MSADLSAEEDDNERGIVLSPSSVSVPEGGSKTYTVKLASQPSASVTVTITKATGGDADLTVNKSSLTFTTANWSSTQTVTVSAAEDNNDDDNGTATFTHTASGSGSGYVGVSADLSATEADTEKDNQRGITLSKSNNLSVPEGSTATYTVKLASQPSANVTVTITKIFDVNSDIDLTVDTDTDTTGTQDTLTFTTSNWDDTQTVTVTAREDNDGFDGTAKFGHVAAGGGYDGVSALLTATEADNDRGIVLSPASVTVPEGSTKTYTVKLKSQPTGPVTVTIGRNSVGDVDLTVNKSSLTFTRRTWNQTQAVTVTAKEETGNDSAHGTATFTHMALNGGYDNVSATLTATESDNDRVVGMPATLLVTEGATSTYTVKLAVQPSSNVRLKVKVMQQFPLARSSFLPRPVGRP